METPIRYSKERLIVFEVLEKFDQEWGYFYEPLFSRVFRSSKHSLILGYFLLMVAWLLNSIIMERIYSLRLLVPDWWWYCFFVTAHEIGEAR